jgi:nicotinate phosphoribosyltransferase
LRVRRYADADGRFVGDMIYDEIAPPAGECVMVDPADATRRTSYCGMHGATELLVPVFERGECVWEAPALEDVRARTIAQLGALDPSHLRFLNPHVYKVGIELGLHERKTALILAARGLSMQERRG